MKINKLFVQEVAHGKYMEYDSHGEMQRAAQRILDEKVVSKFRMFCFRAYGKCMPDNVFDIYDAFVDFASHGAEIKVKVPTSIHPTGYWQVFGMTAKDSLCQLYHDVHDVEGLLDAVCSETFKINGEKGMFHLHLAACRYAFIKGHMPDKDAVEACRVA